MKHKQLYAGAALLALVAGTASAGGLDRSGQSVGAIFAPDGTASMSFGVVRPSITGKDIGTGASYDNVGESYTQPGMSFTNSVNEKFSYSVIFDQPFGADIAYGSDPETTNLGGTSAELNTSAISLVGRYKITDRISVFGGASVQRVDAKIRLNGQAYKAAVGDPSAVAGAAAQLSAAAGADISAEDLAGALAAPGATPLDPVFAGVAAQTIIDAGGSPAGIPAATLTALGKTGVSDGIAAAQAAFAGDGGYQFDLDQSTATSYFVGAAYEIPSIAMRIAGTYRFEATHKADATEAFGATGVGTNKVEFVTPASFNLEGQTGIAENTLLTFGYRWAEWGAVDVVPAVLGSDLVNLNDSERYSLGVARRFNEKFAGSLTLSYESEGGDLVSPLGPTNGLFGVSLGGQYSDGNMKVSGGINYTKVGDARPEVGGTAVASFEDNHVVGFGLKVDFTF